MYTRKSQYSGQGFLLFTSCRSNILNGRQVVCYKNPFSGVWGCFGRKRMVEEVDAVVIWLLGAWRKHWTWRGVCALHWWHSCVWSYKNAVSPQLLACSFPRWGSGHEYWGTGACPAQSWDDCILSIPDTAVHPVSTACVGNSIWGLNCPKYWKANYIAVLCFYGTQKVTFLPSVVVSGLASECCSCTRGRGRAAHCCSLLICALVLQWVSGNWSL